MTRPTVYLAGPIAGLSFKGCTDWRNYASEQLALAGIKGVSPMRAKDYLSHLTNISETGEEYEHLGHFSTSRAVYTRDRFDCMRCDVLLINLVGAERVSIGTMFEAAWADSRGTPIVCAMEENGNLHSHMMLSEMIGFRVPTLDEALHCVKAILI